MSRASVPRTSRQSFVMIADRMSISLARNLWIAFALALAIKSILQPRDHSLFPCFSAASEHWWKGWSMFDRKVMPYDYRYSPSFAILFSPFMLLPSPLGGILWAELNLYASWIGLRSLAKTFLFEEGADRITGWWLTLSLLGIARSIWPGQCNMLILSAAIGALVAIRRKRFSLAGMFLVAPIFIKVWPVAFLLLCVTLNPRKLILPVTLWTAFFALFPFLTQGYFYVTSEYHEWYLAIIGPIAVRIRSYDAWAVWEAFASPVSPRQYAVLQFLSGAILAITVWLRKLRNVTPVAQNSFLLWGWTSWQVLFGPGVERLTLAIVSPLSAWILLSSWTSPIARAFSLLGFLLTQAACNLNFDRLDWNRSHSDLLHPAGMLLLWFAYAINTGNHRIPLAPPQVRTD